MTLGSILADSFPQEGRRIGLIDNGETGLTVKVREMVERNAIALAGRKGVHEGVKQPLTNSVSLKARIDLHPAKHEDAFFVCSAHQSYNASVQRGDVYDVRRGNSAVISAREVKLV
jgi:hypothetical protein